MSFGRHEISGTFVGGPTCLLRDVTNKSFRRSTISGISLWGDVPVDAFLITEPKPTVVSHEVKKMVGVTIDVPRSVHLIEI